jgi:hypothetical protein
MASRGAVIKGLRDPGPPIWWRVMRDLTSEREETTAAELPLCHRYRGFVCPLDTKHLYNFKVFLLRPRSR